MRYVIIGNSAAAVGCIEGIRQSDRTGTITVISDEPHHTYSRPLISYLLCGKTDERRMKYRPESFYEQTAGCGKGLCTFLPGKKAVKIDPGKKTVSLDDGRDIPYDRLLVAAGSRPFVPPMKGLETVKNTFTFMTLDSAKALEEKLDSAPRVRIIGAGLIGLKCAEGIADRTGEITVVDLADRILPSILDAEGAEIVQKHIERKNVGFILSDSVEEFRGSETGGGTAFLKSGKTIVFDIVVVAVGVRPNTSLVSDAGGRVGRGIETDEFGMTTLKDVYAAGDCTESFDISCGQRRILALLPNAYMQGECAGINMAGGRKLYDNAIPMNAVGFFGLHVITAGSYTGTAETVISAPDGKDGGQYRKFFTEAGRLRGFILIGDVKRAGIYTALVRKQTDISTIDFDLVKYRPQLMAFHRKERADMLAAGKQSEYVYASDREREVL